MHLVRLVTGISGLRLASAVPHQSPNGLVSRDDTLDNASLGATPMLTTRNGYIGERNSSGSISDPEPQLAKQQCGPSFSDARCPDALCCSHAGRCGSTLEFCTVPYNCQKEFGRCNDEFTPLGGSTLTDARRLVGAVSYNHSIAHCIKKGTVALTFDVGLTEHTSQLLDTLKSFKAKATFFISGNKGGRGQIDTNQSWRDLIKRMVAEGHQVASQSYNHIRLSAVPSELRRTELLKNERVIANIIGKYPTYVRPPYSDCTSDSGCQSDMQALGNHLVHFDLDTKDTLHGTGEGIEESKKIVEKAFADAPKDGTLLTIQHDMVESFDTKLTEFILQQAKGKKWKAVTVGECLNDAVKNWYREPMWKLVDSISEDVCAVSEDPFCGTLGDFSDRQSCFEDAGKCAKQAGDCFSKGESALEGCERFSLLCKLQLVFCATCGESADQYTCEGEQFVYHIGTT